MDQTKPPSFAAQTGRLDFSKGFLGTEEPTAQKDAWNKSRSNLPSALHRAMMICFIIYIHVSSSDFQIFCDRIFGTSRLSVQLTDSPVVEDKSPRLKFSCPRPFGERLTPAVSYRRYDGGTDSTASRSAQ